MPVNLKPIRFKHSEKQSGFTLIELLVVIVLISIILSMATLAITSGTPKERLKTEARRFAALLQLAQDDSLLNATEFGISLTENSYQFVRLADQRWQAISDNNSLRLRKLPADMEFDLELDYQDTQLSSSVSKIGKVSKVDDVERFEKDSASQLQPQIYILSSGELAPSFMLHFIIKDSDMSFSVEGTEDGSVKIQFHQS